MPNSLRQLWKSQPRPQAGRAGKRERDTDGQSQDSHSHTVLCLCLFIQHRETTRGELSSEQLEEDMQRLATHRHGFSAGVWRLLRPKIRKTARGLPDYLGRVSTRSLRLTEREPFCVCLRARICYRCRQRFAARGSRFSRLARAVRARLGQRLDWRDLILSK